MVNRLFMSVPTELYSYCHQLYFNNASLSPSSQHLLSIHMFKMLLTVIVATIFLSLNYVVATLPKILCAFSQFSQQTNGIVLLFIPILQKRILSIQLPKILQKEMMEPGLKTKPSYSRALSINSYNTLLLLTS